jgi:hypothetical protein
LSGDGSAHRGEGPAHHGDGLAHHGAIGKLISAISSEEWIEIYEQSRLLTKAGQAQSKGLWSGV